MMRRALMLAVVLVAASVAGWGISIDPGITYNIVGGTVSEFSTIAIPFYVSKPIYVGALGAFDYLTEGGGSVGLTSGTTISVSIQNWDGTVDTTPDPGSSVVSAILNSSSPEYGGSVWTYLQNSVRLGPGWYFLTASGFTTGQGSSDPSVYLALENYTLDTFGGRVQYGTQYLGGPWLAAGNGSSLTWLYGSKPIFIAGGSFAVPEPSSYLLMASVGVGLYLLRRHKPAAKK